MTRPVNEASAAFVLPLAALAMGHVLSNAVRTLPAISADVLMRDLGVTAEGLAALTGAFHFAFAAAQIPVGVALDRFGVRAVALTLVALVAVGAALAAIAGGPLGYLVAQITLGIGCSGMMLCPITLAAKVLTPGRFGLWTGLIQALGNCGMLLSASPLAYVVEGFGWRMGYWANVGLGVFVLGLVATVLRRTPPEPAPVRSILADAREVLRMTVSPRLRNVVVLGFCSFAVVIGMRGLWGGPWLMDVKGFSRIEAGNILLFATLSLVIGPALSGVLDRRFGHRRLLLVLGHGLAAVFLGLEVLGAGQPAAWDVVMLFCFGLAISMQPLIFALTREAISAEHVGRAMAAVNLSFFLGAAVLQAASGPVGAWGGPGAALAFLAGCVAVCTLLFMRLPGPR
ncbi:putative MFS family arabinose efflux permease [Humitalea rosea]|uniref:Putative MFS family arabinose efflux permease n=1 Tax=Humitalea rosea TaxID=990373 RepID=A0A2W7HUV5_9PROT|nr:MFS transporter [Humitalea rosea]PZW38521.1 putative MFS family arabinose efflux permease [Humitalea rosea]